MHEEKQLKTHDSTIWSVPLTPETATEAVNIDQEEINPTDSNIS